jgi:hypothetical protein
VSTPEKDETEQLVELAKRGYQSSDKVIDVMNFEPPSGPAPGAQLAPAEPPAPSPPADE